MNTIDHIKERFQQFQAKNGSSRLTSLEEKAFNTFNTLGIPTVRNEEWKYTRISSVFNKEYSFTPGNLTAADIDPVRLPGHTEAIELVFVNGIFNADLSVIRSSSILVQSLEEASKGEHQEVIAKHLGNSSRYVKDGILALNTAFVQEGIFIHVKRGKIVEHPVYIYYVTDARSANVFAQPRTFIHVAENAQVQFAETFATIGAAEGFTNHVAEFIVEQDAMVEHYKFQNDRTQSSQVSTTHFRQTGKSYIHTVTISLDGGIVRNNLSIALEAEFAEANLHGLYYLKGQSHVDNHTVVDHVMPNCPSNELYKGVVDDQASAVFNGKIFVQPHAQKTNAYQSNKNVLLSDNASVNTKPQLEIFADDVKCSHGCTVGQLDEEGLFYLQSRGINEKTAKSLLVNAFAVDILEYIKSEQLRSYVDQMISERLEFNKE